MHVAGLRGRSLRAWAIAGAALLLGREGLLAGVRRVLLALALLVVVATSALALVDGHLPPTARAVVAVAPLAWWCWWRWGYLRGGFPRWGEAVDVAFVVLLSLAGGPLDSASAPADAGIYVRSLYGSTRAALLRAVAWWALDEVAEALTVTGGERATFEEALWQLLSYLLWTSLMRAIASTLARQELLTVREQALWRAATGLAADPRGERVHRLAVEAALDLVGRGTAGRTQLLTWDGASLTPVAAAPAGSGRITAPVALTALHPTLARGLRDNTVVRLGAGTVQLPLVVGERLWGALVVEAGTPLNRGMLDALQTLTSSLSLALHGAALTEDLQRQARHDALTGLANRALLRERTAQALARARRDHRRVALLLLDLDGFKAVNDALGHAAGDRLLVEVADRLRAAVRPADTVARLGGDEFAVLLDGVDGAGDARQAATRALASLAAPLRVEDRAVKVTGSIGVAVCDDGEIDPARGVDGAGGTHQDDVDGLLRDADTAMYTAKRAGKARYAVFDPRMRSPLARKRGLEVALRRGLERGAFQPHYQPILCLFSGRAVGVEALARWHRPSGQVTSAAAFVPAAEATGQIVPIGWVVLEQACRQLRRWRDDLGTQAPGTVGVNLSAAQLAQAGLVADVERLLAGCGLPPEALELEVAATGLRPDVQAVRAPLHELRELGVRLAVGGFGAGSSLELLRRLPVDTVKVDRAWVADLAAGEDRAALSRALLGFAANLDLRVVAEGIERPDQAACLRANAWPLGQGNHLAPPVPPSEATTFIITANPAQPEAATQ